MRLKLYRHASMAEAMAAIRAELGPEALILGSRRIGKEVEISAALEPTPGAVPENLLQREAVLAWHRVPPPLDRLLSESPLEAALAQALQFVPLPLAPGADPLLLVGAPGAGKTLSIARLAARLVMAGTQPMVLTADARRAGAAEQLAAFMRLLGLPLRAANDPLQLGQALALRTGGQTVLIDTPGVDPFDQGDREELAALAATAGAVVVLVLPAGLDSAEAADMAAAFAGIGATFLLPTRLDIARRLGGVLAAAHAGRLALAEAGVGPGAADGLISLTPALLAERLQRACGSGEAAR